MAKDTCVHLQSQPFPLLQVSADALRGQLVLDFMLGIVRQETLDVPTPMVVRMGGTASIDNAHESERLANCGNSVQRQTNNKGKRPLEDALSIVDIPAMCAYAGPVSSSLAGTHPARTCCSQKAH